MKRLLLALVVPVLLVILPLALRPSADWSPSAQERLVIITPNSEQIKYEFEHAFREWYKAHRGRDVMIDWRSPGGTSDIVRYINDRFEAEFRLYALQNGLEWNTRKKNDIVFKMVNTIFKIKKRKDNARAFS